MEYQWSFAFLGGYKNTLLTGALNTVRLSLVIMMCGMVLGCLLALARTSRSAWMRAVGSVYIELFRNVPSLVLLFWFYYAIPVLTGLQNERFMTAAVAFSLYTAAYFCEIFRSGVLSIPRGQWEAARALAFNRRTMFIHVILPQVVKNTLPALTNEVIEVVKISAVASTIAFPELLYQAKLMSDTEYRPVEAYSAVAVLITGFIILLSTLSYVLEHRLKKSS